ncbi:NAD(P)-binding protein [Mycena sanguinolenta]|uniref:NAD(P)-binding protein n=1 Tax=Mycena sanguinolenta TaxID=230812 RepID=A0A8H7CAL1_9AGAR|nr:NAD(P)-binding protein [Mycena sanguinolenta]
MALESSTCVDCGETHPSRTPLDPTPFHSLIDEGLPDAVEKAAIHEFIRDTDAEIVLKEEEIVSREEAIHRLRCEIIELRRRSERHKAIVAPIRRIPPEIMAEVFCALTAIEAEPSRCSSLYDFVDDASLLAKADELTGPDPHKAPLIFCQVSRQWRAIALSTPRLWNCVSLDCTYGRTSIFLCDMWLKRSGSLPLSIRFYRHWPDSAQQVVDDCQDLLRTILPYAQRWRLIDIENVPTASYDVFDGRLPDSLPALEALFIDYGSPSVSSSTPWAGLRTAPKLRLLRSRNIDVNTRTDKWLTFPWSHLTHINVERCSTYDCLQILCEASTAIACRFRIQQSSSIEHPPVFHSTLQILRIRFYVQHDIRLGLICPRLETLAVWMEEPEHTPRDFVAFIAGSGAAIENLTLEGSSLDDTQFLHCLVNLPRLRNLRIEEYGVEQFTNRVWESLIWRSSSSLVPDLKSLDLEGGTAFSHKALVRMLESRARMPGRPPGFVPKLETVNLIVRRNLSMSAVRRINGFTKYGLDITLDVPEQAETGSEASVDDEAEDEGGCLEVHLGSLQDSAGNSRNLNGRPLTLDAESFGQWSDDTRASILEVNGEKIERRKMLTSIDRPATPHGGSYPVQIGFVGLGAMGGVMAKNLANHRAAHVHGSPPILVWNRTTAKADSLFEELGQHKIRVAKTLEQIVTECDVIFTALANDETVKSVYEQFVQTLKHTPPARNKIFVETSTIYPTLAGELDVLVSSVPHCHLIASPVFGTPYVAAAAQLLIVMSGDYRSKKEVAYMLVPAVGRKVIDLGGSNAYFAETSKKAGYSSAFERVILAESYTLAEKSGIAASEVHSFVKDIFPAPGIIRYSERMSTNQFDATTGFSIDGGIKDASHIRRLTAVHNSPMPSIDIAHQHLITARAIHKGQVQAGKEAVEVLDWSGMIAGARVAAGLDPFETKSEGVVEDN